MDSLFVNYDFVKDGLQPVSKKLFEYLVGTNGIFVRAVRPEMEAMIWMAAFKEPMRGLKTLEPYITIEQVPECVIKEIFRNCCLEMDREILFYLRYKNGHWMLEIPKQIQSAAACKKVDPSAGSDVVIEIHSHNMMKTFFSKMDDSEESAGFRIYSVIGNLGRQPTILTRVGIYGHFYNIPSCWVYALPPGLLDELAVGGR